ncbi:MAG: DUF4129 domain-containing protein [Pseudomonadota bacterium]
MPAVMAQDAAESQITPLTLERNGAYSRTVLFERLQTDVVYVDTLVGEIPIDGVRLPPPPEPRAEPEGDGSGATLFTRILLAITATALLVLAIRHRHLLTDHLRGGTRPRTRAETAEPVAAPGPQIDAGLIDRLRAMPDRKAALIELVKAVLGAAALQNGLRLGRAETARGFTRRLPRSWPHTGDAQALVKVGELVQFGGRPLSRQVLEDCLNRARPILEAPVE